MYPAPIHQQSAVPPKPRPRQANGFLWMMLGILSLSLLFLVLAGVGGAYYVYWESQHIASGVSIAGVPVGGQTLAEAETVFIQNNPRTQITLTDGERAWQMDLAALGVTVDVSSTLQAAKTAPKGADIQPKYIIDLNQTQTGFIDLSLITNIPPAVNQEGRALEIPVMLNRFYNDATGELADGVLDLTMIQLPPIPEESPNLSPDQTTTHIVEAGQELGLIAREYGVTVEDIVAINNLSDANLIDVGQELIIPAAGVYVPAEVPAAPTTTGKAIVVSTGEQRIYAYENGQMIHTHLTSTGLPATPTVLGDYKIYVKYTVTDMRGADYYLPNVPYTMYFYQGYGIHGAYWHNSFGRPMSHGCVNLPIAEAEWFFNWAEVGTPVRVI